MNHAFGLISVVVPVYNGAPYVADAIRSILAQEYGLLEIIVVDDGSTDDTAAIVQQFGPPVRYYHQANQGSSMARNYGTAQAKGEWLAFLDADDLWTADKLTVQAAALQQNPTVDVFWGHVAQFSGNTPDSLTGGKAIPGYHVGTMLIRKALFVEVGLFSTTYQLAEMMEWITRLQQSSAQQLMLPDLLMYRRVHETNKGKVARDSRYEYLHALKQHLDRTRSHQEAPAPNPAVKN